MAPAESVEARHAGRTKRTKEATIYTDQQIGLDGFALELQDARSKRVERITANTLIRVAIDGLLTHRDRVHGDTEEELRASWLAYLDKGASADASDDETRDKAEASGN
jgi:hypothetical protein